jgi:VCBS repeat-containing protein
VSLIIPDNVGPVGGDEEQVLESGLADGSSPNDDDILNSSFTLTALDGLSSISINGTDISAAALANSTASPIAITTTLGTLVVNGYAMAADGTITVDYTYTLADNQDHSTGSVNDDFTLVVTDTDGDTMTDVLNISIVDDVPTANDDITRTLSEGGNTITGNVIANTTDSNGDDVLSADRATEVTAFTYTNEAGNVVTGTLGDALDSQYGTLIVNANGSWTYTSDTTEDHSASESLTESFTYTLSDSDGDSDTATQSLTVTDGIITINNPDVYVYEGSSAVTFDGSANYDKSQGNGAQDTTSTLTHKLDFTTGGDLADIVSFTFNGSTQTIASGSSATIVDANKGTLTVHSDGTWSYIPPATYEHDSANGVNNFESTFTYVVNDTDGDVVTGSQTIRVDDTLPVVESATNSSLNEENLADGSNTNLIALTQTGTINATQESGAIDITFSDTQAALDTLITNGLSSSDNGITYSVSGDGYTLTASATISGVDTNIFIVTITNPTDVSTVGYEVQLLRQLDHEPAVTVGDDIVMSLSINITDDDGDIDSTTFNVTIVDDVPTANDDITRTLSEGGNTITGNVIDNTTDDSGDDVLSADSATEVTAFTYTNEVGNVVAGTLGVALDSQYGTLTVNANGSWEYTSDATEDHSASESLTESFTYTLSDSDGDSDTATQSLTVTDGINPSIDNTNNATVIVYEGSSTVTFDGSTSYEKSQTTAAQDTSTTLTHKLDFTAGNDNAGIVSFTFDGTTQAIAIGSSATIVDNDKGTLTVHYDGTWTYTPPATYLHADANGVNNFATTFTYEVSDTDGDEVTTGSQSIQVDDTLPVLDSTTNTSINEANFASGSNPIVSEVTKTEDIDVTQESGAIDITFSDTQTALDTLITNGLSSSSNDISYNISGDGHTLTASATIDAVVTNIFVVTITNPTDASEVAYEVQLLRQLDHELAVVVGDDIVMNLAINIADDDGDKDGATFTVTIVDDAPPANIAMTVNEDSTSGIAENTITTHADATQANTVITTVATYGSAVINADGTLTYVPDGNFSGEDTLVYTTTLDDGNTFTTTVTVTVTPIADAPTALVDSNAIVTEEDTAIALGLNAPTQPDSTDASDPAVDDIDNPELYGVITLTGIPDGAKLFESDGTTLIHDSDGSAVTIKLSNGDHVTGVTADLTMTVAEYESMKIQPSVDSHENISVSVSVSSYEVNSGGSIISGITGATTTETVTIDVQAVTDSVSLTYTDNTTAKSITIDEDTSFDLSALLTESFGDSSDLSETFTYELSSVPVGSIVTIDGTPETVTASGIVSVSFTGATTPTISIAPPKDFSGGITGISITLKALDSDSDSTDVNPSIVTESASVTLDLHVNPIANDVALSSPAAVPEDTPVAFLTNLTITDVSNDGDANDGDTDGNDRIIEITIGNLDAGFELTTADGTSVFTSTPGNSSFTITLEGMTTTTNPQTGNVFTFSEVQSLLLDSHQAHSSADILLDITVKSIDSQNVDGSNVDSVETTTEFTATNGNPLTIEVTAVSETKLTNTDDANGNDVTSQGSHTYIAHANEDTWIDLNALDSGFALSASNEDDVNSGLAGASETTMINLSNVAVGSMFTVDGGTTVLTVTDSSAGVDIPLANLGTLQFMPVAQFSGTVTIHMAVKTTDYDEDDNSVSTTVTSAPDILTLEIDPVADNVTLAIKQASGNEDAGRDVSGAATLTEAANGVALDITTTSDDTDGSETFVVTISGIPDGGEIYYNGTLMNSESGATTNVNDGVTSAIEATNNAGDTWSIQIDNFDNDAVLTFIPEHNDNSNYTLSVKAHTVDGADDSVSSEQTLDITVNVKGVADAPENTELNRFDSSGNVDVAGDYNYVTTEATLDSGSNQFSFEEVYQSANTLDYYDTDGSESLTMIITGLDSQFNIENATFMGGVGTARQWIFNVDDIANINVNSPVNFSGEIDLTVRYITTENDGDNATFPVENVKILVTPSAEANISSSTTIDEDELTLLDFSINHQNEDVDETIDTIYINKDDVDNGDFTLYLGASTAVTLDAAVGLNANISLIDIGGSDYYQLTSNTFNSIYALSDADSSGTNTFEVKYDIKDTAGAIENTLNASVNYNLNVNAITDDIDVSVVSIDGGSDGAVSGTTVTVTDNTTITVDVKVIGTDDAPEANGIDSDGSEQVTMFVIENVSQGITVVGGTYSGDIFNESTGQYDNSGIWYIDINNNELILDSDGVNRLITFNVDGDASRFNTSTIKITAFNEDSGNGELQNDFTTLTIIKDGTYSGVNQTGTPATISDFSVKAINILEDSSFTLDQAITATITGSSDFAIVITDVLAGSTVSGAQKQGDSWVISGSGDSAAILVAMQAVTITPPENYNSFDNLDSDTFTFNATITTLDAASQNNSSLSFDKPVYPLTDDLTIAVAQDGTTAENIDQAFTITLSNPADGDNTAIIDGKLYIKVTEDYTDTGTATGSLLDSNGNTLVAESLHAGNNSAGLVGDYYVISDVNYQSALDFVYQPGEDRQGSVDVDIYIQNQEADGWDSDHPHGDTAINLSSQQFSFDVTPVIEGSSIVANNVSGTEDDMVAGGTNWVELDLSLMQNDLSESLVTALLDNVPVGFLVYYQDPSNGSNYLLAYNAGTSTEFGNQFNQWSIPLNSAALPDSIFIQAPEHWSGTIEDIKFTTLTAEEGLTSLSENSEVFDLTINAVADGLTLNPTKTFGNEGDDIALNFNANAIDLDGSETVTLTIVGIGENANFKVNSQDIDDSNINYNSGSDTYTISNVLAADINSLSFVQQYFTGTVNVTAQTIESSNNHASAVESSSFSAIVSQVNATASDDTLFYRQGNNVDALSGDDTLILSNDVGIDFTSVTNADGIENIEVIDLEQNGIHNLESLSLQDVIDMTDSDNDLTIQGDSADSVSFINDDGWVKDSSTTEGGRDFDIYINSGDPSVTVKVEQDIVDTIVNATTNDDTLFYKTGNGVDGLAGDDTLILSNDVGIDFTSVTNADGIENIEVIDLQQNGIHDLESLSLQDVIDMTDDDNDLIIQGDSADSVSFANNDGWVKDSSTTEGGRDYDVYINSDDASVTVKVEQDIMDTIIT